MNDEMEKKKQGKSVDKRDQPTHALPVGGVLGEFSREPALLEARFYI